MNERIRKHIRESHLDVYGLGKDRVKWESTVERFSELLLQECMACSTWVGKMNTTAIEPVHTAHAINQRIRKHFGVEE